MGTYETKLIMREEIAESTMAFHFTKPPGFSFKAGQAVDVVLSTGLPTIDAQEARHTFSVVSAPYEDEIVIATRMRDSAFKRSLKSLPIGSDARFEGPFGSLTLHSDRARPAVMVAGGIGITPFISILRQAAKEPLTHHLILLYSNRRPEQAAFLAELLQLERQYSGFHLIATMTQSGKSSRPWDGKTGLIDEALIVEACRELTAPIYYLTGSPGMVETMRQTLNHVGIEDDDIRSEEFFGY